MIGSFCIAFRYTQLFLLLFPTSVLRYILILTPSPGFPVALAISVSTTSSCFSNLIISPVSSRSSSSSSAAYSAKRSRVGSLQPHSPSWRWLYSVRSRSRSIRSSRAATRSFCRRTFFEIIYRHSHSLSTLPRRSRCRTPPRRLSKSIYRSVEGKIYPVYSLVMM